MRLTGGTNQKAGLERVLERDSHIVIGGLIFVCLASWLYILTGAGMDMREMASTTRDTMMTMSLAWTPAYFALMLAMWWVMMVAMMVPSAAPMILIFARVQRKKLPHEHPGLRVGLLTFGYLLLWLAFSLGATLLQWGLGSFALLSPMLISSSKYLGVAIFLAAGIYQLTPLKQACLAHCRSPISFFSSHWRQGDWGALGMGLHHGAYCVGCCWFLMGLLFFGGVMNLLWIAAIAIFVLLEKILPAGQLFSRVSGIGMLCLSVFLLSQ